MTINKMNSPLFAQGKAKWDAFVQTYQGPYDFSHSVYAGMNQKVSFVCPTHGEVKSDAKNLINGKICQKCMFDNRKGKNRLSQKKVIARFVEAHNTTYDYSETTYAGQQKPVVIKCKVHGSFKQKPEFHWNGAGCQKCFDENRRGASQRGDYETFVAKAKERFGDLFDIPFFTYTNTHQDIVVHCTKHNLDCNTRVNWISNGYNPCPKCNHMKSAGEDQVAKFLSIFTTVLRRDRSIIGPKELDIVMPDKTLALEYCGMFWHSHGDKTSEDKDKNNHYNKFKACADKGIRLITMYESEWQNNNYAVKRLLRNAIGKSKGKLMARKCELKKATTQEARAFYEKYHPQGGTGHGEHYALYWKGKIVACMRFVLGANDRGAAGKNRVWTLGRYATRITVSGGASRLFKAFLKEFNPECVKSFSDNRYFAGGMYEQLGFDMEEDVAPDYQVWSPKIGIRPKSHYQRRALPARIEEHSSQITFDPETDSRTEKEVTYLIGARRIYDCGKKRWVWNKPVDTP